MAMRLASCTCGALQAQMRGLKLPEHIKTFAANPPPENATR
jgi:hypothetical protein